MAKVAKWMAEDLKAEKVGVIWANTAFGKGGRDTLWTTTGTWTGKASWWRCKGGRNLVANVLPMLRGPYPKKSCQ